MNPLMYGSAVVQAHLGNLRERGVQIIEPRYGQLASATEGEGVGRLAEPDEIVSEMLACLQRGNA